MRTRSILLAAVFLAGCGPSLPPEIVPTEPEDVRVVYGRLLLYDGGDLEPAPGIALRAFFDESVCRDVRSDADGRFRLDRVPFVDGHLEIVDPGFEFAVDAQVRWVCPFGPSERNLDVVLNAAPGKTRLGSEPPPKQGSTIRGRVLDEEGRPLPGATVEAEGTGLSASTNREGRFRLTGLRTVEYALRVRHPEKAFVLLASVKAGGDPLEVRALPGKSVGGLVVDAEGRPMPGVTIRASVDPVTISAHPPMIGWDRSDRSGRFKIGGLPDIQVHLSVDPTTWAYYMGAGAVPANPGSLDVVISARVTHFETPLRVEGTVIDLLGDPVAGAEVIARPIGFRGHSGTYRTAASGRFCILGLSPGPYEVVVIRHGLAFARKNVLCGADRLTLRVPF